VDRALRRHRAGREHHEVRRVVCDELAGEHVVRRIAEHDLALRLARRRLELRPTNASTTPRPRPRLPPVTIAVFVIASSVSPVRAEHVLRERDVSLAADEERQVLATDD
jgi:hypothetical protein